MNILKTKPEVRASRPEVLARGQRLLVGWVLAWVVAFIWIENVSRALSCPVVSCVLSYRISPISLGIAL